MGSGPRSVFINPSERLVSLDTNRLQQLYAQFESEFWRSFVDTALGVDDLDGGSIEAQNTTQLTPDSAIIWSGLRVVPAVGSLNLTLTPGMISMLDPDASPDPSDSPYKRINDAGLPAPGIISMTGNSSGSTRIDVIEAARVPAPGFQVFETDNRDVYNNATGLFSPQTLNKIIGGALTYRVRQGTPGSGFPGSALGWVPLCVASVPNGATTNDTMTFWDVRPMASDRAVAPFALGFDYPRHGRINYIVNTYSTAGKAVLVGVVDATGTDQSTPSAGRRRLGGRLRTSSISADFTYGSPTDGLDLNDSNNWDSAFTTSVGYIYLLESPFGLPRWVRYTGSGFGSRVPRAPRGFVVVSHVPPAGFYGSPLAQVPLPAATGLGSGSAATKGICIGAVLYTAGAVVAADENWADGRTQWNSTAFAAVNGTTTASTTQSFFATLTLTDNGTHPGGAKAVWATVTVPYVAATGQINATVIVFDPATSNFVTVFQTSFLNSTGGGDGNFQQTLKIPLPPTYPLVGPDNYTVHVILTNVTSTNTIGPNGTPTIQSVGWDLF